MTRLEKLARDESSIFLQTFVNYGRKKFYKIGPDRVWHLIFGGDDYPDEDHLRSAELFNWKTGKEPLLKGRLCTTGLLVRIGHFVKKKNIFSVSKEADLS